MSLWKKLKLLWHGDEIMSRENKKWQKSEDEVAWSIYGNGHKEPVKSLGARLYAVHVVLKGRIIRPITWILGKYTKKHYKGVPLGKHNQNLQVFDRAYDKAITEWHQKVLRNAYCQPTKRSEEYWDKIEKTGPSGEILRTAKETALLIALNDTAYRNFMDILMYNIWIEMSKEYKNNKPQHLIYVSSDVTDVDYYHLHTCLKTGERRVYKVGDKTCCEFQAIKEAAELIAADAKGDFLDKIREIEEKGLRLSDDAHKIIEEVERLDKEKFVNN
jgi:hypothetical protein